MFCPDCGCDLEKSFNPITEEFKGLNITVNGIHHYICPKCGEYMIDADGSKELFKSIREQYKLLTES